MTPELERILTYRTLWSLCVVNSKGKMRATHFATCVVSGRSPLWILWTIHGRRVGKFGSRDRILEAYPGHAWRRTMARWGLKEDADTSVEKRREMMVEEPTGELV